MRRRGSTGQPRPTSHFRFYRLRRSTGERRTLDMPANTSPPPSDPIFLAFQSAVAGRYSIDRELGRGGMGIVYLAHEVHLDRLVAIKLLPPERAVDPMLRERFLREARLAAKLSHPNIIPIHAVEERDDFVYYVMAFVEGQTLTDRVRTRSASVSPSTNAIT